MNIEKITVRNYRGIVARTVEFAQKGVTVLQGPNEMGKSSMIEAFDIILKFPHTSTAQEVVAIKPVNEDVGTEIDVVLRTGDYHVRYYKRFHKKPEAVLDILAPNKAHYTSAEAHNGMNEILKETMDQALFRAVRLQQGMGVGQAKLGDVPSLQEALDRAAGGNMAGQAELTLFQRIQDEYTRYFTLGKGKTTRDYQDKLERAAHAEQALHAIEQKILSVQQETETLEQRERLLQQAHKEIAKNEEAYQAASSQMTVISELEDQVTQITHRVGETKRWVEATERRYNERVLTSTQVDQKTRAIHETSVRREQAEADVPALRATLEHARSAWDMAKTLRDAKHQYSEKLRRQSDFLQTSQSVSRLEEQLRQVDILRQEHAAQLEIIQRRAVTEEIVDKVQKQYDRVIKARAVCDVSAPVVTVTRLATPDVLVDSTSIAPNTPFQQRVAHPLTIVVPGVAEVVVAAGASFDNSQHKLEQEEERLLKMCHDVGLTTADAVKSAWDQKLQAQRQADDCAKRLERLLDGNSYEQWQDQLLAHKARLDALGSVSAPEGLPTQSDLLELQTMLQHASYEEERAVQAVDVAQDKFRVIDGQWKEHQAALKGLVEVEQRERDEQTKSLDKLQRDRQERSDDDLLKDWQEAQREAAAVAQQLDKVHADLVALAPDDLREHFDNLKYRRQRLRQEANDLTIEIERLKSRLETKGAEGLYEQKVRAQTVWQRADHERTVAQRQASAAKLLFKTFSEARTRAQGEYRQPLSQAIERLGRLVYGRDFAIELNDDLMIARRYLNGLAVPFSSLSKGAQEQLVLLTRLAAAQLVAGTEGVPVIFDDALGSTDESRLEGMGTVLNAVGRTCQVIILTCIPSRYSWVGSAHAINIALEDPSSSALTAG